MEYKLQLYTASEMLLKDTTTIDSTYIRQSDNGVYHWNVRAQNTISNTAYCTRTSMIDVTVPEKSNLLTPKDNAKVGKGNVLFFWKE